MSMIFSRAPLRISLGGGGTDLPSYFGGHGGFLVAGAIDKYVYMLTHTVFQRRYRMKYNALEEVDNISEIRHPILRETLLRHWHGDPLEIASVADVPAGTGLGSSGAYTVCLLKGLAHARKTSIAAGVLAEVRALDVVDRAAVVRVDHADGGEPGTSGSRAFRSSIGMWSPSGVLRSIVDSGAAT